MENGGADQMREMFQSQAHIWNHIFNFINSMSLKCAVQLGIPEAIHNHGRPMTLSELVSSLAINQERSHCLQRLMRILSHSGFFAIRRISKDAANDKKEEEEQKDSEEDYDECYVPTPPSRLLLKDEPQSVAPFLLAMLDPILTNPWQHLSNWFLNNDRTPFSTLHGRTFWDYTGDVPRLNHFFAEAMASDARLVAGVVTDDCKGVFEGLSSLVDVAGGTGTLTKAIADAFPDLNCTALDLPHVIDGLQGSHNLKYIGGDMFEAIPSADAVLLKWILHDWSDEEAVKILKKCKEAIPSREKGGKVIIIDMVLGKHRAAADDDEKSTETKLFFDMLMMVLVGGREREEREWAKLFQEAGFSDYKITPVLGPRSLIQVFP